MLVEAFRDAEAGQAHVQAQHFAAAIELLNKLLAEVPEIVNVEIDAGWSRMAEIQLDSSTS